jgi:UDP-N-acetylenolpyruvoylglucosamine reductase
MGSGCTVQIGQACEVAFSSFFSYSVPAASPMISRHSVPLASLTTMRVGGPAARLVRLERETDLVELLVGADAAGEAVFVLGTGSNVVVGDGGFPGLVVQMALRGIDVTRDGDRLRVDVAAGEDWDAFVQRAVAEGWRGVACMSGVPGLVGATPIQNVGAYGQEVRDTITSVRVYDRRSGTFADMGPAACRFDYRTSIFKRDDRWIVTRVSFVFDREPRESIRYPELSKALGVKDGEPVPSSRVRETVIALRRGKGMVLDDTDPESVSAGSFFVNPIVDAATAARVEARAGQRPPGFPAGEGRTKLAAAWLVERAGFTRGWTLGRAGVSRKHALAIVNRGGATAVEVLAVARAVRDGVRDQFGVTLEPEPVLVGCAW